MVSHFRIAGSHCDYWNSRCATVAGHTECPRSGPPAGMPEPSPQPGLAVLNYHDQNKKYPIGFVPTGPGSSIESWTWTDFILPELEEQVIYDRLRPSNVFLQPVDPNRKGPRNMADLFAEDKDIAALQSPLSVFRCPSDPTPALIPVPYPPIRSRPATPTQGRGSVISTARICHPDSRWPAIPSNRPRRTTWGTEVRSMPFVQHQGSPGQPNWVSDQAHCDSNGIFYGNSQVSARMSPTERAKHF